MRLYSGGLQLIPSVSSEPIRPPNQVENISVLVGEFQLPRFLAEAAQHLDLGATILTLFLTGSFRGLAKHKVVTQQDQNRNQPMFISHARCCSSQDASFATHWNWELCERPASKHNGANDPRASKKAPMGLGLAVGVKS